MNDQQTTTDVEPVEAKAKGPNTSLWTVKKYLEEIYLPARAESCRTGQGPINESTAKFMRCIVRALDKCMGREVRLREVNQKMLDKFAEWSVEQGCKERTGRERGYSIKGIVREWRPEKFPRNQPAQPFQPHWQSVDLEGSLEQIFQEHYLPANTQINSPTTIKHYGRMFKLYGQYLEAVPCLVHLNDDDVARFLRWLNTEKGVKAITANGYVKQIKAFWNWAAKRRLVEHFPTVGKLKEPEQVPKAWSRDELQKLIQACHESEGKIKRVPANLWWVALHRVLWDSGERVGAVLELDWTHIDLKTGHLTVPAEIRKGRKKAMSYRLKPATIEAVKAIRSPHRELIFPFGSGFNYHYKQLVLRAGLPYERFKSGPQKMRRTFASFVQAAGGDATRALRHSTTRVTDDSYLDPAIVDPEPPNLLLFDLDEQQPK